MAINFPNNPVNGNTYKYNEVTYIYSKSGTDEGYWKVALPQVSGVATPDEVDDGLNMVKYISPWALAESGYVRNINDEPVLADGSTTARDLSERFADVTNVKDFGAVGDGSTDDTAAIQDAINYRYENGGGRVYIPQGYYIISDTIQLRTHVLVEGSNASVFDSSKGVVIELAANSNCDMFRTFTSDGNIPPGSIFDYLGGGGLQNVKLEGNRRNQSGTNDPVTGRSPNCLTISRWLELGRVHNVVASRAVGFGIRIQDSTVPIELKNISLSENGEGGLSLDDYCTAGIYENISGSRNPVGINIDPQVKDISGHIFINAHFEKNAVMLRSTNGFGAPINLITPTSWGDEFTANVTSGSVVIPTTEAHEWMLQGRIRLGGAGVAGVDLNSIITAVDAGVSITINNAPSTTVSSATIFIGTFIEYIGVKPCLTINGGSSRARAADFADETGFKLFDDGAEYFVNYIEKGTLRFGSEGRFDIEDWNTPALLNSWVNYGAPHVEAAYMKDPMGTVFIQGTVSSGTDDTSVFNLPTEYRPNSRLTFAVTSANQSSDNHIIIIDPSGDVISRSGSVVTSDGITMNLSFKVL